MKRKKATRKREKTEEQKQAEIAANLSTKTATWKTAAQKLNTAVRFSFLREIKAAHGCEYGEAVQIFETAVQAGEIVKTGENAAGDVFFYRLEKY